MKEWHGMVLAKNKKIMISTIPLVILSLVCFKENPPAQASTKSLDTGESFTEVYNKDNGFYLNSPFYDISKVSKSVYVGESGAFNQVKVLPIYNMTPKGSVNFYQNTATNNLIGATLPSLSTGTIALTQGGQYTAQKAGTATVALTYMLSSDFKKELLSKYPDAWTNIAPTSYGSPDFMYAKYSNQTFYVTIKEHTVPLYRMYNPNSGEHFYTENSFERDSLVKTGWNYEGISEESPIKTVYNQAVYRVYNPNAGDHFYTENKAEVAHLVSLGWRAEGIAFYSSTSTQTPIYRLYNPNATVGTHFYTQSSAERDSLVRAGWNYEGTAWYGG